MILPEQISDGTTVYNTEDLPDSTKHLLSLLVRWNEKLIEAQDQVVLYQAAITEAHAQMLRQLKEQSKSQEAVN